MLTVLSSFFIDFVGDKALLFVLFSSKDFEDSKSESLKLDSEGLGEVLALSLILSTFCSSKGP